MLKLIRSSMMLGVGSIATNKIKAPAAVSGNINTAWEISATALPLKAIKKIF